MNVAALDALASCQWGLILRSQALEHFTPTQIDHLVETGQLLSFRRCVYRLPGAPLSFEQELMAVTLSSGDRAVVSHRAAARLYGLARFDDARPEFAVPHECHLRVRDGYVHHLALPATRITMVAGIPVTTVARTLVDLCATSHAALVEHACDHALFTKLVTLKELDDAHRAVAKPGARNTSVMQAILTRRIRDKSQSELEREMRRILRRHCLPEPKGQFELRTRSGRRYPDLAYPDQRVVIEVMGYSAHGSRSAFDEDQARLAEVAAAGFLVIPYTSATDESVFVEQLRAALRRKAA